MSFFSDSLSRPVFNFLDDALNTSVVFGYDKIGFNVRKQLWDPKDTSHSLAGKVIVITGASSGIGRATAQILAGLGAKIIAVVRDESKIKKVFSEMKATIPNADLNYEVADLSLISEIKNVANSILTKFPTIDVLINNAGVLVDKKTITSEGIELTFATNTLAYYLFSKILSPALIRAKFPRIINVTSGGMYLSKLDVEDPQFLRKEFDGVMAYAQTKRQETVITKYFSKILSKQGVFVACMHPGWADTPAVQVSLPLFHKITNLVLRTPEEGADTIIYLSVYPHFPKEESGNLWFDRKIRTYHRFDFTSVTEEDEEIFIHKIEDLTK
jgi:NAD(P)-dependent dehydrogenase (short-subunit alcohol dehydrogenase family)